MEIPVEVDTHVTSIIEFASGVLGTFICRFGIWANRLPAIEIYGSLGTLSLPRPYRYDGAVEARLYDEEDWRTLDPTVPLIRAHSTEKVRGLGVVDSVESIGGGPHRTNAGLAFHTLEILEAMESSNARREFLVINSHPDRPPPVDRTVLERWMN